MKRLKVLILLFCMALSVPVTYVVWRTYRGVAAEEHAQLRFFAAAMLDEMETEMAALVSREENRAVDEYQYTLASGEGHGGNMRSPLATLPEEAYIIGYFQNGPGGSFESPLMPDHTYLPANYRRVVNQLKTINREFNAKKFAIMPERRPFLAASVKKDTRLRRTKGDVFSDRFFTAREQKSSRDYLGQQKTRIEEITPQQAMNITKKEKTRSKTRPMAESESNTAAESAERSMETAGGIEKQTGALSTFWPRRGVADKTDSETMPAILPTDRFQAEVAPLQSVFINANQVFIFRRVVIDNQIYRQGFVLMVSAFLRHLSRQHFIHQPMAAFTGLRLRIRDNENGKEIIRSGVMDAGMPTIAVRTFPAPFDWFSAIVAGDRVPASPVRQGLTLALSGLGLVMLLGLFAIYRSAHAVMRYAERRQQFVSSVTHELKTPLTNIRMYVEMLEQGVAPTPEREQAYLKILNSESARLSGLINNVLELSKLEKKQRHFNYQEGRLADVFATVRHLMANPLARAGFILSVAEDHVPVFSFDREVLVQVLCNLVENSIKFGRNSDVRQIAIRVELSSGWVDIHVSDTGPGIPKKELGRVFDDFYRVDNDLTRNMGGTGIGLALVKKFVIAMGGRVSAANNDGPGCTITIRLPGPV